MRTPFHLVVPRSQDAALSIDLSNVLVPTRSCFSMYRWVRMPDGTLQSKPFCYYVPDTYEEGQYHSAFGLYDFSHANARIVHGSPDHTRPKKWVCGSLLCCERNVLGDGGMVLGGVAAVVSDRPNYNPPVNDCGSCPDGTLTYFTFRVDGIGNDFCTDCDVLNQTWELQYEVNCFWRTDWFSMCEGQYIWAFTIGGDGVTWVLHTFNNNWLYLSDPEVEWDCKSPLTLYYDSDGDQCSGWPASITLYPVRRHGRGLKNIHPSGNSVSIGGRAGLTPQIFASNGNSAVIGGEAGVEQP